MHNWLHKHWHSIHTTKLNTTENETSNKKKKKKEKKELNYQLNMHHDDIKHWQSIYKSSNGKPIIISNIIIMMMTLEKSSNLYKFCCIGETKLLQLLFILEESSKMTLFFYICQSYISRWTFCFHKICLNDLIYNSQMSIIQLYCSMAGKM